jgi:anhydro-N-acetylmuramic acid kinase
MSGTSMDGVDAALVDVATHQLLGGITRPYDHDVRERLYQLESNSSMAPSELCQLNTRLGRQFAATALQLLETLNHSPQDIAAIGSHGQTICHDAQAAIPYTLQLGCPHTIAEATGINVVADFRTRDLIVGGKGAPFAPLYHQALWGDQTELAIVNIGGIANITLFPSQHEVIGYDTGPGNCLLDAWIKRQLGHPYDQDGAYAASGAIIPNLLTALGADPYFKLPFPKSLCKSYFSLDWLQPFLRQDYAGQDIQATLLALTASSIARAVAQHAHAIRRLAICGGGVHNGALMQALNHAIPNIKIMSTQALGINPDFLEAMMFAWLAHQNLSATQLDLRTITGAHKQVLLGAVYWK